MVIDTNILIAYLKGEQQAVIQLSAWKEEGRALFISPISIAEVLAIAPLSNTEIAGIKDFLKNFISIPVDDSVAEIAGYFRGTHHVALPDAIIAATAFLRGVPLITRDQQFKKIKEVTVFEI